MGEHAYKPSYSEGGARKIKSSIIAPAKLGKAYFKNKIQK
jgi:hypothetical protein